MNWRELNNLSQLEEIIRLSQTRPQLIFKHSTRCFISKSVLRNFESDWPANDPKVDCWFLDLLAHRDVSGAVEKQFLVRHESPQAILIQQGQAVYNASHDDISAVEISGRVG